MENHCFESEVLRKSQKAAEGLPKPAKYGVLWRKLLRGHHALGTTKIITERLDSGSVFSRGGEKLGK